MDSVGSLGNFTHDSDHGTSINTNPFSFGFVQHLKRETIKVAFDERMFEFFLPCGSFLGRYVSKMIRFVKALAKGMRILIGPAPFGVAVNEINEAVFMANNGEGEEFKPFGEAVHVVFVSDNTEMVRKTSTHQNMQ